RPQLRIAGLPRMIQGFKSQIERAMGSGRDPGLVRQYPEGRPAPYRLLHMTREAAHFVRSRPAGLVVAEADSRRPAVDLEIQSDPNRLRRNRQSAKPQRRILQTPLRVPKGRAPKCLSSRLVQMERGAVPHFTFEVVVSEGARGHRAGRGPFERPRDRGVQQLSPGPEELQKGDLPNALMDKVEPLSGGMQHATPNQ